MDLIVSTSQGEAEISVNAVHESVTIGDLLGRVLSSAPPNLVFVDGRPTPSGTLISAAGLVTGTVIDVTAPAERSEDAQVTLVQAAGEGGGNRRPLQPGRYSLGTARRANVAPLSLNQVLVPRCEVVVAHSGQVMVTANQGDLDGHLAVNPARWEQQRLRIGHRVFRLDGPIPDRAEPLITTPAGQLHFVRPARDEETVDPEPNGRSRNSTRRGRRGRNRADVTQPVAAVVDPARQAYEAELDSARRVHLDLAEVVRRATQLSTHLWERRPADPDAFLFSLGLADQPWTPEDAPGRRDLALLPSTPVIADLINQRGIGFAGTPPQARAAARALVMQACVAHSPTDLDIVVLASATGASRWEWIKWLPHARGSHGVQLLSDEESITDWVNAQRTLTTVVASIQALGRPITPSRLTLAVVDDPSLWRGRAAMLRGLFAEAQLPVRFVAITDRADDIPAVCTTVVRIEANGAAEVDYPISGPTVTDVVPFVLEHDVAVAAARKLSPLEDHSAQQFTRAVLPPVVSLASQIDPEGLDAARLAERWAAGRRGRRLRVVLGVGETGPIDVDLAEDGPHAVILGASRSGKTDLLRTIVASLIAAADPSALNVVCVEPSNGSSFGMFATVEHVVGAVTDFDEHGGVRLLRALHSEVTRRARLLADVHAGSIAEYQNAEQHAAENGLAALTSMPRLVIVIDDADDVTARHAAFLPQLIDLADRGRHLGLHVIVAAEQLARSVEQTVKSIAHVRVALRMNDPAEAIAYVGTRDPVQVSVHTPGRGTVRIGDDDPVQVQFASAAAASGDLMEITPFIVARDLNAAERRVTNRPAAGSEPKVHGGLHHLVEVVDIAAKRSAAVGGASRRRQILCPELPVELPYDQIAGSVAPDGAPFAWCDLPDDHTQNVRLWNPGHDGNVLVIGGTPAERSSVLATLVVAATDRFPIDRLHAYVIDAAPGQSNRLGALETLPACGAVATPDDPDRISRVLVHLHDELDRRASRDQPGAEPHIAVLINDIGSLLRGLEIGGEFEQGRDVLDRLVSNGPMHGITTVMSSSGEHGAPARMLGQFQQRIILRLDDRGSYRSLDIESGRIPPAVAGRAITVPDHVELQIAVIADLPAAVADRAGRADPTRGPEHIARTPESVSYADLGVGASHKKGEWLLPIGLDTRTLRPALLQLQSPSGVLILGGAGSGKSTLLGNIARSALAIAGRVDVHAIAATWSPLLLLPKLTSATTLAGIDRWATEFFGRSDRTRLVLVDDADRLEGPIFERLAGLDDPKLVVVAAGRLRDLEQAAHWTAPLRRSRLAVILRPVAGDAAMFGLHLRVASSHPPVGRGVLIDDDAMIPLLLAGPPDDTEEPTA